MNEVSQKIRNNAMISYFLIFVSLSFLVSKDENVSHPFVKSHVKSAFILHILLLGILFIMSYNFFPKINIFGYSLNTIITASLCLFLFAGILYGAFMAFKGKNVTLWEIFHSIGVSKHMMQTKKSEDISEEHASLLIMCHVPFLGYMIYAKHKNLAHIRDIVMINFLITCMALLLFVSGFWSLASILILLYIIYSVFQGISLMNTQSMLTPHLDFIPEVEEKYIIFLSLIKYTLNTLKKKTFIALSTLKTDIKNKRYEQEKQDLEALKKLKKSIFPDYLSYIPLLNIATLFSGHNREIFHRRNGIILTLLFIVGWFLFFQNLEVLLFFAFPVCYGIWYSERKAYRMPFIYDIYAFLSGVIHIIKHIFTRTRTLQKTHIKENIKIGNTEETKTQE